MLQRVSFKNYKAFAEETTIELRPVTVLLGKNSSGKSSVCKLMSVLSSALSGNGRGLLPLRNSDVVLGSRYEDLFHSEVRNSLVIDMLFDNSNSMSVEYLIDDGEFLLRRYAVGKDGQTREIAYRNSGESKQDNFVGLTQNWLAQEVGLDKKAVVYTVEHIGPLRKAAKRAVFSTDIMDTERVGYRGENTPYLLLDSYLQNSLLLGNVSQWYDMNMDGQRIEIIENGSSSGSYSFIIRRGHSAVNLADVGEGTNQLLPVIVQTFAGTADLTIIEQPALHLHPAAHASVAYQIARTAKRTGRKYLIESHSENFVLGLRHLVANGEMNPQDVALYFIDHDGESAYAQLMEIEANGDMQDWPEGIFEEDFELLKEIKRAQR